MGSSTAVLVKFDERDNLKLRTLVLGDSGYVLLRSKAGSFELIFSSKPQFYSFDFPF
jgi:hypothetical protein